MVVKRLLLAGSFIGLIAGWITTNFYQDKTLEEYVHSAEKAEQARAEKYQIEVDELYEKYQNALNVKPAVVDRVVYVKGNCPVQADTSTAVGDGADAFEFRLNPGTVRGVERVTNKHESLYKQCAAQLRAAQALLSE